MVDGSESNSAALAASLSPLSFFLVRILRLVDSSATAAAAAAAGGDALTRNCAAPRSAHFITASRQLRQLSDAVAAAIDVLVRTGRRRSADYNRSTTSLRFR